MRKQIERKNRGPLPPILLLAAMGLMVFLHFIVPVASLHASVLRVLAGVALLSAGIGLNLWADSQFKRAGTTVKPFEITTALIQTGAFAFSRHPMYLGMLSILIGLAIALGSLTPWLVVPPFARLLSSRFMVAEERNLEEAFGERYLEYKTKVRRWL